MVFEWRNQCFLVLTVILISRNSHAFVQQQRQLGHLYHSSTISSSSIYSSNSDLSDDEISKLIGKRSQIRRKKKEEKPEEEPEDISLLDTETLNFDKMPEFKTQRPLRKSKAEDDKKKDDESAKGDETSFVDFAYDHEDENEFHVPNRLGFSTIGWGDPTRGFVIPDNKAKKLTRKQQKSGMYVAGDIQMAFNLLMEAGVCLVETSSKYGSGSKSKKLSAQEILARCIEDYDGNSVPLAVENLGSPLLPRAGAMKKQLEASCANLGLSNVEQIQVKKLFPFSGGLLAKSLVQTMEEGSCNYVGVVGITTKGSLRRFQQSLESKGAILTSNAFEFSLTNNKLEGMIDACKDLGVIPYVMNPLDNGLSSGVYTATNPSGGEISSKAKFTFEKLEKLQPLHSVQETVAERVKTRVTRELRDLKDKYRSRYGPPPKINTDITTTQVAINYVVAKGGVPVPEINTPRQAEELLGCLGWTLSEEEVDMLDAAVALCKI